MRLGAALVLLLMAGEARADADQRALCLAVAKDEPSACDALKGTPSAPGLPSALSTCRNFYNRAILAKALISHDPSFMERCVKGTPDSGEDGRSPRENEANCRILLSAENNVSGACARIVPKNHPASRVKEELPKCAGTFNLFWGSAQRCSKLGSNPAGAYDADFCLVSDAAAAFRRAHAAGEPGLCGGDALCRAMMGGGPEVCAPYVDACGDAANKHFLCLALAKKDAASCDPLKSVPAEAGMPSALESCRNFYGRALLSKAFITHDPKARAKCLKLKIDSGEKSFSEKDNAALCGILAESEKESSTAACAKMRRIYGKYPKGGAEAAGAAPCEEGLFGLPSFWGYGAACSTEAAKVPYDEDACSVSNAVAAFRKADEGRDPELCGPDSICRVLMGAGPEACGGDCSAK